LAKSLADEILFIPVTSNYNVSKQMWLVVRLNL
jgi:hypothetical protein